MKTVQMYEAEDGTRFTLESQCAEYERHCANVKAANLMLESGATLMSVLDRLNYTNPQWDSNLPNEDRAILLDTTKDTGFVVSHWQGSNKPGYKVQQVNVDGQLYLFGDAGAWSGPYGDWVHLSDFLRYAHQTKFSS